MDGYLVVGTYQANYVCLASVPFQIGEQSNAELRLLTDVLDKIKFGGTVYAYKPAGEE
jgi:hypothetical protein